MYVYVDVNGQVVGVGFNITVTYRCYSEIPVTTIWKLPHEAFTGEMNFGVIGDIGVDRGGGGEGDMLLLRNRRTVI